MSASFGKQSSKEQSTSASQQGSLDAASSFGVTGSQGASTQVGSSNQSIAFNDLFQSLYGGASAAAAGVNTGGIADAASQLFSGGTQFLGQLMGNDAGTQALANRVGNTSARDAQLGALGSGLGDFFTEQLLPAITGRGVSTGTLGGSRDAVATSLAAKQVAGQYAQSAAQIIGTDQAQQDQAATSLAGLTQQGAATGLNSLSSLFGLAQNGAMAGLSPYTALAGILGGPTTLTSSSDIAQALSNSFGNQGSQSYGYSFGTSNSQSTGNSKGFNIGASAIGGVGKS